MSPTFSSSRSSSSSGDRLAELAANLDAVRERIERACAAASRDPAEITLIGITKTRPASDVRLLAELGLRDVGENRDAEAAPKARQCAGLGLTWHFVGQLQTNKARSVVGYANVVHSVDRERLVRALGAAARNASVMVTCLVQVGLDAKPGRGGASCDEVPGLARAVAQEEGLRLGGVMAVAPLGEPPEPAFAALADCAARVRAQWPSATIVSAGMSDDLEAAIAAGATHVRIGTALLGNRTPRFM